MLKGWEEAEVMLDGNEGDVQAADKGSLGKRWSAGDLTLLVD